MAALFTITTELRMSAADSAVVVADAEAQERWLGPGCSLPRDQRGLGVLAVGGSHRRAQRQADGTFRIESGDVVTSLAMNIEPLPGKRPRCRVTLTETLAGGEPSAFQVAGWEGWWGSALGRLDELVDVVRRRRVPAQAVVVIHGIGEQRPGDTLRAFVEAATDDQRGALRSKPDHISTSYELRRISMATNHGYPKTDFFELYWAHHIRDTTTPQVLWWLAGLMVHPRRMRAALRPLWATVVVASILLAVAAVAALVLSTGLPPAARTILTVLVIPLVLAGPSWVLLKVLGDAPRYLSPSPTNVDVRDRIRTQGVRLLLDLHRSNRYDRIVVVGHSLGSAIAYDMVNILYAMLHLEHHGPPSPPRKRAPAVNGYEGSDPVAAQLLQYGAWEEARRATQPWLITDLVTVGSPLAHAALLIGKPDREVEDMIEDRQLTTCPPVRDESKGTAFYRDDAYKSRDGNHGNFIFFHHAAPFATTRWTNLYVPIRKVLLGDVVGGPLAPLFGGWVRDVKVESPYKLAHTRYWSVDTDADPTPDHIVQLRRALALKSRPALEKLLPTIPPYAQMDPPKFGPMRHLADRG